MNEKAPAKCRLRILMSSYACQPDLSSEPGAGWNTAVQMCQDHEVWVLTNPEHRPFIEQNEAHRQIHWVYVDPPHFLTFFRKGERGRRIHYYLWQIWAYFSAKPLVREQDFDLIHHVTYASYWTPSFLALLPVPFLWGPVGGGESAPAPFRRELSRNSQIKEIVRDTVRWLSEHLDIFVRKTSQRAVVVLSTSTETEAKLKQLGSRDIRISSDIGLADNHLLPLLAVPIRENPSPVRFISMGRLIGWKGYHLSIRAFALLLKDEPNCEYWVLGTGAEKERLEQLALDCGIGDKIRFWGRVPREEVPERLAECDILLHPSLHETGAWTCPEAMAAGRPVICLDLGGPATNVTDETGIKVPAETPEVTVQKYAQAMLWLAREHDLRRKMGEAGRIHVQETFSWQAKREFYNQLYEEVSHENSKMQQDKITV